MIGVIANPREHNVVREFFELFKTPWEFYRTDRCYEVVLCAGDNKLDGTNAKLVLVYAGTKTSGDAEEKIYIDSQCKDSRILLYKGNRIPIYGDSITFRGKENGILTEEGTQHAAACVRQSSGRVLVRIGYDLFHEIHALLTVGQPPANASLPALELHIALLRDLIVGCGIPLAEIPPVPDGYRFVACLTHDVDHPSIRQHKWDHTMFGFLYRAVFGSVINVIRGRATVRNLLSNWAAALRLPFVHFGIAKDFWCEFDRYLELEKGLSSTFFVLPVKNYPGRIAGGSASRFRASRYAASDIAGQIQKLLTAGCEIGLHGIDAWLDSSRGREELEEIRRITGMSDVGVRMHWLYNDQQSPLALEKAGAAYDSTIGYNETVGYRAGTTQVYKPLQVSRLLELPLHVMDTALFYPSHLKLSPRQARTLIGSMVDNAVRFGGSLTINWHDRSIAPERLWDACYVNLVQELKDRGAWFSTAGQAVSWFRKRRSAVFETVSCESNALHAKVSVPLSDQLPGLRLRVHNARGQKPVSALGLTAGNGYVDIGLNGSIDTRVVLRSDRGFSDLYGHGSVLMNAAVGNERTHIEMAGDTPPNP
jgi:hypothetical protein